MNGGGKTSSIEIVMVWAHLDSLPPGVADLRTLWAASGNQLAADWRAGAVHLAALLQPLVPGQQIDGTFIQNLDPTTVDELAAELGW
jgi:hypothetical protein